MCKDRNGVLRCCLSGFRHRSAVRYATTLHMTINVWLFVCNQDNAGLIQGPRAENNSARDGLFSTLYVVLEDASVYHMYKSKAA
jgi:hypothetical protein